MVHQLYVDNIDVLSPRPIGSCTTCPGILHMCIAVMAMVSCLSVNICNRVDNTHPDTLAQTFYLRPVTIYKMLLLSLQTSHV